MSVNPESSICMLTLNYCVSGNPATSTTIASWWYCQIDGLKTPAMKDAMKSEYPELEKEKVHNRMSFYSPEELNYFPITDIITKITQYLNSLSNFGYRLVTSTTTQDSNTGCVQYQYCLQEQFP